MVVVGGSGRLRQALVECLEKSSTVGDVIMVDGGDDPRLDEAVAGAEVLVDLQRQPCPELDQEGQARGLTRLVAAAAEAGVRHVVVVSSAAVYGAWADNAVPLTEEMPLRPNPDAAYAAGKVEVERRWGAWAEAGEGRSVTILRPALVVGDDAEQWLAVALRAVTRWGVGEGDGPIQFVHVDDVAAAVALAVERRLDGVYNVAPEGWLGGQQVQVLTGTPLRPPVPPALAAALARWCWSRGLGGVVPGLVPYATHPWVVAGDRLRAEGWEPAHSGAETLVDAYPATPWTGFAARTRRMVTLGGGAALGLGAPVALLAWVRHRYRGPAATSEAVSSRVVGSRARRRSSAAHRRAPRRGRSHRRAREPAGR